MTIEQIRRMHATEPFQPFELFLVDGRRLLVPHQEFLYIPPRNERTVYVADEDDVVDIVDLLLVVSIKPLKGHSNGRRRKAG